MAITSVPNSVSDLKFAVLYANQYEMMIEGITIKRIAFTGVPVRGFNSAAFSGSRRSNAAAKITREEERKTVPAQPNHHKLINTITTN